jgi:cis-L-3-hydroxyproline dehydratase
MIIQSIAAYQVDVPLKDGSYAWSEGKAVTSYDSTIVRIDTDEGITGWAEVCPLGPVYLPAYAAGARTGIAEIAPHLLGKNPLELEDINQVMDGVLKGHPYVKSPFDIACWDILGKATDLPVCTLLGGRFGDSFPVYHSVSQGSPEEMVATMERYRASGIRAWQLKVGGPDTAIDIARIRAAAEFAGDDLVVADANTGWLSHQALRVASAVRELGVAIEQPCLTYDECVSVRRHTDLPFVLDECIDSVESCVRAYADNAMDVVNVKIGKVGGLSKARQVRDLCISLGIALTIEDMPGSDITGATILHLAHSTPERFRFSVTSSYLKAAEHTAEGGPEVVDGHTSANTAAGLGVDPHMEMLGAPIFEASAG